MPRDTFESAYACEDCGRDDFNSIRAALLCNCDRFDRNGYPKHEESTDAD